MNKIDDILRRSSIEESIKNLSIEEAIRNSSIEESLRQIDARNPWLKEQKKSKLPLILAGTGAAIAGSAGYLNYLKNKQQEEASQYKQADIDSLKEEIYKQARFLSVLKSSPKGIKNAYLYNKASNKLGKATNKISDIAKVNKELTENVSKLTKSTADLSKRNADLLKGNKAWKTVSAVGAGAGAAGVGFGLNERRNTNNQIANSGYLY